MSLLGTLLKNRRSLDAHSAWNRPNLQGPETLLLTSSAFDDGQAIPREYVGKRIGGRNLSPQLGWSAPPPSATELLLIVEDLDVPTSKPAVHCLALLDPARLDMLPTGGLAARGPATGVRILRSTVTRGYHGPEPIKGHGPHRYTFQLFALGAMLDETVHGRALDKAAPRALMTAITAPVVARGRLTGTFER